MISWWCSAAIVLAARVSVRIVRIEWIVRIVKIVRNGACEREEWRCLLVALLKVCSIAERGTGCGRTSSSWLARGVEVVVE